MSDDPFGDALRSIAGEGKSGFLFRRDEDEASDNAAPTEDGDEEQTPAQ